jgi:serine/threonine protein phosphatase 1
MEPNTYVIGDIHGQVYALRELLYRVNFDKLVDRLIVLGDVCDRGPKTGDTINCLREIRNLVLIKGNHDVWALAWMMDGVEESNWLSQGGRLTVKSYGYTNENVPVSHIDFLRKAVPYYVEDGCLFVHGGFDPNKPIEEQKEEKLVWDRDLINYAKEHEIPGYKMVFIGHTPTKEITGKKEPAFFHNLVMLDCGAGHKGNLCIMNKKDLTYTLRKI